MDIAPGCCRGIALGYCIPLIGIMPIPVCAMPMPPIGYMPMPGCMPIGYMPMPPIIGCWVKLCSLCILGLSFFFFFFLSLSLS